MEKLESMGRAYDEFNVELDEVIRRGRAAHDHIDEAGEVLDLLISTITILRRQRDIYKTVLDEMEFRHTDAVGMSSIPDAVRLGKAANERIKERIKSQSLDTTLNDVIRRMSTAARDL